MLALIVLLVTGSHGVQGAKHLSGSAVLDARQNFTISVSIFPPTDIMIINLTGPDFLWFGVGFGNQSSCPNCMNSTYAIVCTKDFSGQPFVEENSLALHGYGEKLNASINVLSDHTQDQIRMVSLSRVIQVDDRQYFSFPTEAGYVDMIYARGLHTDQFTSVTAHMGPRGFQRMKISDR